MFWYIMWATHYTPNNDTVAVPGVLSDGRLFTDYSTDSINNAKIRRQHNIYNNEEYRRFLVKNTSIILKTNYETMEKTNRSSYINNQATYGAPKLYMSVQDDSKPFGYEDSSVKQMFLTREQIDDKKRRLVKENY
jgi:hypothetical protein